MSWKWLCVLLIGITTAGLYADEEDDEDETEEEEEGAMNCGIFHMPECALNAMRGVEIPSMMTICSRSIESCANVYLRR